VERYFRPLLFRDQITLYTLVEPGGAGTYTLNQFKPTFLLTLRARDQPAAALQFRAYEIKRRGNHVQRSRPDAIGIDKNEEQRSCLSRPPSVTASAISMKLNCPPAV
jgi:hypothetical protein